jgi:FemAB-related protein (PEP-CTERM system-associated)
MRIVAVQNEEAEWESFVAASEDATSYHRFGWRTVFSESFDHPCHYLAAVDDTGRWQGVLPLVHMQSRMFGNFLVSLPFVSYGGLLCRNEEAGVLLLAQAEEIRRTSGATHVELRHLQQGLQDLPTRQHKVTMMLELRHNAESQWKCFRPETRNQIRKAEKCGLQFAIGHLELLDRFYDVFARNMRDLGTPVYTKRLFRDVLEVFADTTRVFTVLHQGKTIAAGIGAWFRDTLEMPWASSIRDYRALCPNHLLYWGAIRFAVERGFRRFDFGRSTPDEGTYRFKKSWGAAPVPLRWQYLMSEHGRIPELNPSNPRYRFAIRAWQRLPVSLTKILGPRIVRHIP